MRKVVLSLLFMAICSICCGANAYRTRIFAENIRSLQVLVDGQRQTAPFIELGAEQSVRISFDELSYEAKSFYFRIIHCNADWTQSDLSSMEYVAGFDNGMISDYGYSQTTTINYINYQFWVPNEDLSLTVSGNYAVEIAEDNDFDNPVAVACFSVYEPLAAISGSVSGNTLKGLNGQYQQLEIEADYSGINVKNPANELFLTVRQNGRLDNMVVLTRPTFTQANKLIYRDVQDLVFEGGNQYRSIDFSSRFTYGAGIERIASEDNVYHVILSPQLARGDLGVDMGLDADGAYVVNLQNGHDDDVEADYMWVHFWLPMENPMLNGSFFLMGDIVENAVDKSSLLTYDFANKGYYIDKLLKQGGYNYMFGFRQSGSNRLSLMPMEGSFWQTENTYRICLYYRAFGARYDRLIAVGDIIS